MRRVDKIARDHTVPARFVLATAARVVYVEKVAGAHREAVRLVEELHGRLVRKRDGTRLIAAAHVIAPGVHVRMNGEAVGDRALVQDEVRGDEHVIAELASLALEAELGDLEGKASQAGARHQHSGLFCCSTTAACCSCSFLIVHLGLDVRKQGDEFVHDRRVALGSLIGAFARPVADNLLERCAYAIMIVVRNRYDLK